MALTQQEINQLQFTNKGYYLAPTNTYYEKTVLGYQPISVNQTPAAAPVASAAQPTQPAPTQSNTAVYTGQTVPQSSVLPQGTIVEPGIVDIPGLGRTALSTLPPEIQRQYQAPQQVQQGPAQVNYSGPSVVDYLQASGQASDFSSRARLAQQMGIQNYQGTAQQNTQLLNALRSSKPAAQGAAPAQSAAASPAPTYQAEPAGQQTMPAETDEDFLSNYFQNFGIDISNFGKQFATQPFQSASDLYSQVLSQSGLPQVKGQIDQILGRIQAVDAELGQKVAEVNENPWISENLRARKVSALQEKYESKKRSEAETLQALETLYNSGRQDAQFVTQQVLSQQQQARALQQDQLTQLFDLAEKALAARAKQAEGTAKGFELSPGQVRYEVNPRTGQYEAIASVAPSKDAQLQSDLMRAQIAATNALAAQRSVYDSAGLTPKQTSTAIQLSNSLKTHPAYTDMLDISTGLSGVQVGLAQKNGFGDITAINAFQRMVDPGATVRSEDVALLQTASGLLDKISTDYPIAKLQKGDKLPEAVRQRMIVTAEQLYQTRLKNYTDATSNIRSLAQASQIPFEYVGTDFQQLQPSIAPSTTPLKKGDSGAVSSGLKFTIE